MLVGSATTKADKWQDPYCTSLVDSARKDSCKLPYESLKV